MNSLTQKNKAKNIAAASFIMLGIALVFSFVTSAFADSDGKSVSSFRTSHETIVKGSEGIARISVTEFVKKIGKNTGIFKMIHTETEEEAAAAKAQKEASEAAEHVDPFAGIIVPGWQKLVMLAVGFLIVYLGAAKGFEPLLLIPIGFGTIFVNIPGAGMGEAPHGMLHIIYSAGVGNAFRCSSLWESAQ